MTTGSNTGLLFFATFYALLAKKENAALGKPIPFR
jgi:hypothetical protein